MVASLLLVAMHLLHLVTSSFLLLVVRHLLLLPVNIPQDKDLAALRRAAARLRCGTAYRPCFGDGWEVSKADAPGTRAFHRSTMVYPEEMMFFMVKVMSPKRFQSLKKW